MTYIVSITSQGQISLPIRIRRQFFDTSKALVSFDGQKITIEPVKDLLSLKGSIKTKIKARPQQIREAFELHLAEQAAKR